MHLTIRAAQLCRWANENVTLFNLQSVHSRQITARFLRRDCREKFWELLLKSPNAVVAYGNEKNCEKKNQASFDKCSNAFVCSHNFCINKMGLCEYLQAHNPPGIGKTLQRCQEIPIPWNWNPLVNVRNTEIRKRRGVEAKIACRCYKINSKEETRPSSNVAPFSKPCPYRITVLNT